MVVSSRTRASRAEFDADGGALVRWVRTLMRQEIARRCPPGQDPDALSDWGFYL